MKPINVMHSSVRRQSGAASIAIAVLLMFILVAAVTAVLNMSGSSVIDAAKNEEQVSALFLAESGVERGQSVLSAASDSTLPGACTAINATDIALGRGTFKLTGTSSPTGCGGATPCTGCTITSTGTITTTGSTTTSSRTVVRVMSLSTPSGGAKGCGGGGSAVAAPTVTDCPNATTGDLQRDITQKIDVLALPTILFSNIAFMRHPTGGTSVDASGCVTAADTTSISNPCISQWNTESSSGNGDPVVGSRGASVRIGSGDVPTTYTLSQNLTASSAFAAIGARISGTGLEIIGSFWADKGGGSSYSTKANSQTNLGTTNSGALTLTSGSPDIFPPFTGAVTYATEQTKNGWCNGADTLILGFSGRSSKNANGSLNAFTFGTSPAATPVFKGSIEFPTPVGTTINSDLYSTLMYIINPVYLSPANGASAGGKVTAYAGIPSSEFTATMTTGSTSMTVNTNGSPSKNIYVGDKIYCDSNNQGCSGFNGLPVATVSAIPGGVGISSTATGVYTLSPSGSLVTVSTKALLVVRSSVMQVSSPFASGWLSVDDTLSGSTTAAITSVPSGCTTTCQAAGDYGINPQASFVSSATNITANSYTVNVPDGTTAPPAGTIVGAAGDDNDNAETATSTITKQSCVANDGVRSAKRFNLNGWDTVNKVCGSTPSRTINPFSNAQICGGICAFFNNSSATKTTSFTVTNTNTQQWAAGMTCLKGVLESSITGLLGIAGAVKATTWHEPVR